MDAISTVNLADPALVGAFGGAFIGLLAVMGGQAFSARQSRRRDDNIREQDRRALATALKVELRQMQRLIDAKRQIIKGLIDGNLKVTGPLTALFRTETLGVFKSEIGRIGLLDTDTAQLISEIFGRYYEQSAYALEEYEARQASSEQFDEQDMIKLLSHMMDTISKEISEPAKTAIDRLKRIEQGENPGAKRVAR